MRSRSEPSSTMVIVVPSVKLTSSVLPESKNWRSTAACAETLICDVSLSLLRWLNDAVPVMLSYQ